MKHLETRLFDQHGSIDDHVVISVVSDIQEELGSLLLDTSALEQHVEYTLRAAQSIQVRFCVAVEITSLTCFTDHHHMETAAADIFEHEILTYSS